VSLGAALRLEVRKPVVPSRRLVTRGGGFASNERRGLFCFLSLPSMRFPDSARRFAPRSCCTWLCWRGCCTVPVQYSSHPRRSWEALAGQRSPISIGRSAMAVETIFPARFATRRRSPRLIASCNYRSMSSNSPPRRMIRRLHFQRRKTTILRTHLRAAPPDLHMARSPKGRMRDTTFALLSPRARLNRSSIHRSYLGCPKATASSRLRSMKAAPWLRRASCRVWVPSSTKLCFKQSLIGDSVRRRGMGFRYLPSKTSCITSNRASDSSMYDPELTMA